MPYAHEHKYYLFETKAAFEPFIAFTANSDGTPLYERVEYAILACNCGDVIKRKVKLGEEA